MNKQRVIKQIVVEVRSRLEGESSGHDWWHVWRVWQMARRLAREENADLFVVELAALLHDIADWKLHGGDDTVGPRVARDVMAKFDVPEAVMNQVCKMIPAMAFKGARVKTPMPTLEGKIVQDADRLDALGAIGIARTFAYGGFKGHILYDPASKPVLHASKEAYAAGSGSVINHFYEKLLLISKRMNTKTAKRIARDRHEFMRKYLKQFYREWEGKD